MDFPETMAFGAGVVIAGWTLLSAIRTVILPRSVQSALSRVVFRGVGAPFRLLAHERRSYAARDRIMALFAPVGLLVLAATWVALTAIGFTAIFWAVDSSSWGEAFHLSTSSITTLGFAPADDLPERVLAFIEAGIGLFLVALMVTFLPSLYGAFSRRETRVALLEVRAGSPPSAAEFLIRHHRIGWMDQLDETWSDWELWFAELEESHTSYPALNFFRSPQPDRHWLVAAGTILDVAALVTSTVEVDGSAAPPAITIRAGYITLRRIADFFGIDYDPDPAPDDPIAITRAEFDAACEALIETGLSLKADRDQAWRDFSGWRVNYDRPLLELAELLMAPAAPWTSDRSAPGQTGSSRMRWGLGRRRGTIQPEAAENR
ncbi:MAG: two pore domain potassium channel family protein [Acidimicrobiia bacterium]|nr:two pore domain potassium channel family protein [Acidimicrobiia bacterium]